MEHFIGFGNTPLVQGAAFYVDTELDEVYYYHYGMKIRLTLEEPIGYCHQDVDKLVKDFYVNQERSEN